MTNTTAARLLRELAEILQHDLAVYGGEKDEELIEALDAGARALTAFGRMRRDMERV